MTRSSVASLHTLSMPNRQSFARFAVVVFAMVAFGAISGLAYPRAALWPMIFVSVAGITWLLRNRSLPKSLALGFTGGLAFYVSQIYWISQYLGPLPLIGLATLEAAIFAIGSVGITLTWRLFDSWKNPASSWLAPAGLASMWVLREQVSINFPYGGFPWSRLGMSQSNSPLANFAYLGGIPLISWVVAFTATATLLSITRAYASGANESTSSKLKSVGIRLTPVAAMAIISISIHPPTAAESGTLRIAAVQGNANAGLFANPVPGSILQKHLRASALINSQASQSKPELVVWPENSVDLSPAANPSVAMELDRLVTDRLGVPLIIGTIAKRGEEYFNQSQLWLPGRGMVDFYDKKRPVPFAEYVPDRDFWYALAPDLIGLISHGYSFGQRDGIYSVADTKVGVNICFEIASDELNRDLVSGGANVIVSQTNNSDFGHSDETFQQAAIARLRAIETGRVVVNDSTVGLTVAYAPDGSVIEQIEAFKPGVIELNANLRISKTPAYWGTRLVAAASSIPALGLLLLQIVTARRTSRKLRSVSSS